MAVSAGCSAAPVDSTVPATDPPAILPPAAVVADWIAAVAGSDPAATEPLVDEVSLALMIGAENAMGLSELAVMVADGVGDISRRSYWETFRADFATFAGLPLAGVVVGGSEEFMVDGVSFAAVTVTADAAASEILCRQDDDGAWRIDLMATIGPTLLRSLRTLVVGLPEGAEAATARAAFGDRAPSLRAGLERAPGAALPDAFRIELEALVGYLESLR